MSWFVFALPPRLNCRQRGAKPGNVVPTNWEPGPANKRAKLAPTAFAVTPAMYAGIYRS